CNWRRAMKNSYQAQRVIEEVVKEKPKARWLFLTLSTRNAIDGDTLEKSLKHLTESFRRLFKYKKVSKNLIGFMRSTEVTVNKNNSNYNNIMKIVFYIKRKKKRVY